MRNLGLIILGTFALLLAACQSAPATASVPTASATSANTGTAATGSAGAAGPTVQDNGGGGVTVEATVVGRRDGSMTFKIAFNTHSVDLTRFDASTNMALRTADGREIAPSTWQDEGDSHHRSGTATFSVPSGGQEGGRATLIVRNLAGVSERLLAFDLKG